MTALLETSKWSERRRRSAELVERWAFAAEVLGFYQALLDTQEKIFAETRGRSPEPSQVAAFSAEFAVPRVIETSIDRGPERLGAALLERFHEVEVDEVVRRWLGDGALSPVERYLARAATGPIRRSSASMTPPGVVQSEWPPRRSLRTRRSAPSISTSAPATSHSRIAEEPTGGPWPYDPGRGR